jgi:hypothetical protein
MVSGDFHVSDPGLIANNIMVIGHAWALRRWSLQKRWTFDAFVKGETESIMRTLQIRGGIYLRKKKLRRHGANQKQYFIRGTK